MVAVIYCDAIPGSVLHTNTILSLFIFIFEAGSTVYTQGPSPIPSLDATRANGLVIVMPPVVSAWNRATISSPAVVLIVIVSLSLKVFQSS